MRRSILCGSELLARRATLRVRQMENMRNLNPGCGAPPLRHSTWLRVVVSEARLEPFCQSIRLPDSRRSDARGRDLAL